MNAADLRFGFIDSAAGAAAELDRPILRGVTDRDTDYRLLARAVEIAENGAGIVHPNPTVGAVIARSGVVISEGWHRRFGGPHAEVEAIAAAAGADLTGATMYVSLEPCCHEGKTPPCTDAIVRAGIGRVVVASDDPSSKASGRGLGILRDEGIVVDVPGGELAARARRSNQAFRKHARTGMPWVLFKAAMTLDGKVATRSGDSKWISTERSRALAHRWRAAVDAVAVGVGTAIADDPRLTARVERPDGLPIRQPRRIVFDTTARLSLDSRLIDEVADVPLIVVVGRAAPRPATTALAAAGAEVIVATGSNETARVNSALQQIGERGITSILLEGGPHLAGVFLDAHAIDEVRMFIAPLLIGGSVALGPIGGEGIDRIGAAVRLKRMSYEAIDGDLSVRATIKEW